MTLASDTCTVGVGVIEGTLVGVKDGVGVAKGKDVAVGGSGEGEGATLVGVLVDGTLVTGVALRMAVGAGVGGSVAEGVGLGIDVGV